jgi:tRNA/tmRNA/rRNA uracil-C5-methylase (TrmA/RlmC/RlmD family)
VIDLGQGDRVEVLVGQPAHGGHCVARYEGIVLFVRHALPGERVTAEITEVHKGYLRADAVEVHDPSPERRVAPCRYARPDGCGGCDLQHATPQAQLDWKAAVLKEQLERLGGLTGWDPKVEPLPGGELGWRTRVRYRVDTLGRAGLLKHRSHEVVPIDRCLIAHPAIQGLDLLQRAWPDTDVIDVVKPSRDEAQVVRGQRITEHAAGHDFEIDAGGFWQVHPAAADTLVTCVLELLKPRPGERAWDLYGGAGLFSAALVDRGCEVTLVDTATEPIKGVTVIQSTVERARLPQRADLVVLDPPRSGAGARVVRLVSAAEPRAIAYVACDPAALARDLKTFHGEGWIVRELRAFDLFPQTHHFETIALITR